MLYNFLSERRFNCLNAIMPGGRLRDQMTFLGPSEPYDPMIFPTMCCFLKTPFSLSISLVLCGPRLNLILQGVFHKSNISRKPVTTLIGNMMEQQQQWETSMAFCAALLFSWIDNARSYTILPLLSPLDILTFLHKFSFMLHALNTTSCLPFPTSQRY